MSTPESILREKKQKVTPSRVAILDFLIKSKVPVTVADIFNKISKSFNIDSVTIYRNLQLFVSLGLVNEHSLKKGITHYEYVHEHNHHHAICTKCGTIEDFDICHADAIVKRVLSNGSKFKTIDSHRFELFGICKNCAKNSLH